MGVISFTFKPYGVMFIYQIVCEYYIKRGSYAKEEKASKKEEKRV